MPSWGAGMSPAPQYPAIAEALRELITAKNFAPGELLPSEGELAARFGVARNTLRRALAVLDHDGLIRVVPGRGRVVRVPGQPVSETANLLPVYRPIAAELREQIEHGTHRPGRRLPSEVALARCHGVSRETVRRALTELQAAGLTIAVQGKGWFVRGDATQTGRTSQDVPHRVSEPGRLPPSVSV
jgi:DNA-binding GntR family transcriptional regulator